jgi:hypothetical protein
MRQTLRTVLNAGFWVLALAYCVAIFWSIVVILTALVDR